MKNRNPIKETHPTKKPQKGNARFHKDPKDIDIIDSLEACTIETANTSEGPKRKPHLQRPVATRQTEMAENPPKSTTIEKVITLLIKGMNMYLNGQSLKEIIVGILSDVLTTFNGF